MIIDCVFCCPHSQLRDLPFPLLTGLSLIVLENVSLLSYSHLFIMISLRFFGSLRTLPFLPRWLFLFFFFSMRFIYTQSVEIGSLSITGLFGLFYPEGLVHTFPPLGLSHYECPQSSFCENRVSGGPPPLPRSNKPPPPPPTIRPAVFRKLHWNLVHFPPVFFRSQFLFSHYLEKETLLALHATSKPRLPPPPVLCS